MENKFRNIKIEYHILQTFPVTCLNRDDVGTPKSAIIGGTKRARVSSQCWKRQVRLALQEEGVELAIRTKKLKEMVLEHIDDKNDIKIIERIETVSGLLSDNTLVFFTVTEAKKIADYVKNQYEILDSFKNEKKDAKNKIKAKIVVDLSNCVKQVKKEPGLNCLDLALFGRMIAKAPTLNIEGAASFSHAITTHKIVSEIDYFTAVDDIDSNGAGHIDSLEFTSGTFYRYISLNLGLLFDYFGNEEDLFSAVNAFTKALYLAVPAARQKTQSGYCLWDFAHIYIRKGQEMQLSFDSAVKPNKGEGGYLISSINEMEEKLEKNKKLMGSLFGELGEYTFGDTLDHGIDGLLEFLDSTLKDQ